MTRWISAALATVVLAGLTHLVTIVAAPAAWACSCAMLGEAGSLRQADAVFTGAVTDRRSRWSRRDGNIITVTFDVSRVYKGMVEATTHVTSLGGHARINIISSCDMAWSAPQWLVYADDRGRDGLHTSSCSGTRPMPKELPAVLGAGHRPMDFVPLPYGREVHDRGGSIPWLVAGGLGLLLLAVPGWLALRGRRLRDGV